MSALFRLFFHAQCETILKKRGCLGIVIFTQALRRVVQRLHNIGRSRHTWSRGNGKILRGYCGRARERCDARTRVQNASTTNGFFHTNRMGQGALRASV